MAALVTAALHLSSIPRTIWEYDECFYALGVERFQPLLHHPPPPGVPLYIAFVKLPALFLDPFHALVVTSVIATLLGLIAWFLAFREIHADAGFAAILLYTCPALLISGVLPQSDAGALALFGLAALACARGNPYAIAIACAATVGWRPQFAIAVVPMFAVAVLQLRTWRDRIAAVATFSGACLAWLVPLVIATGGPAPFWKWMSGQAAYYAAHDANLSRSGHSLAQIALRFVAHPWGPKWLSIPLLALAAAGATTALLRRNRKIVPLAAGAIVYLGFAITTMDPADAVRYMIPALPFVAILVAIAFTRAPIVGVIVAVAYALGSYWYAMPVLRARATSASPPVVAAEWIRAKVPRNAIVLYDLPLRPHADFLLREWKRMRIDEGLAAYGGRPDVPMVLYADGERAEAEGVTFRWPDTDAYRKLTRQHYGAVSVVPLPPSQRFRVVDGVFAPERTRDGQSWRWIGARGTIELPNLGADRVRIVLRAPPEYPLDANRVCVDVHGRAVFVTVRRRASTEVVLPIPRGAVLITFTPERSFVPAKVSAKNRDQRTLSVMLTRVEQIYVTAGSR